jgi:cation-transporting ATPase 13A2
MDKRWAWIGLFIDYIPYAILILVSSTASVVHEIYLARKALYDLKKLIPKMDPVLSYRNGNLDRIDAQQLVPGDIVVVEKFNSVPCDLALLNGEVVVDESTLTGESIPIVKTPLPDDNVQFSIVKHKAYVLFAGSRVIQVDNFNSNDSSQDEISKSAFAVVLSTGFSTTKGELFRTLLYPKPLDFKFYRDSFKFLAILGGVALLAFINRVVNGLQTKSNFLDVLITSADLITIAVPPALPLVLTVGIVLSVSRLKKLRIFCIAPERVNFAGRLDTMCWDKTGTLTSSNLIYSGADVVLPGTTEFSGVSTAPPQNDLEMVLATCHGLNLVQKELIGHPLDQEMLQASGYSMDQFRRETLIEGKTLPLVATLRRPQKQDFLILNRFDFDSHLQRSSSQVYRANDPDGHYILTKGSAESIMKVCVSSSIPKDFEKVHKKYALEGYYVLSCAIRRCSGLGLTKNRQDAERDMQFVGFLLFRNKVKPETIPTIQTLNDASIRSIIM